MQPIGYFFLPQRHVGIKRSKYFLPLFQSIILKRGRLDEFYNNPSGDCFFLK